MPIEAKTAPGRKLYYVTKQRRSFCKYAPNMRLRASTAAPPRVRIQPADGSGTGVQSIAWISPVGKRPMLVGEGGVMLSGGGAIGGVTIFLGLKRVKKA
jgi:hypothetical protein